MRAQAPKESEKMNAQKSETAKYSFVPHTTDGKMKLSAHLSLARVAVPSLYAMTPTKNKEEQFGYGLESYSCTIRSCENSN